MDANELRRALKSVAHALEAGEFTHRPGGEEHWLQLTSRQHAAHAIKHLDQFLVGAEGGEDHLVNCAARLLFAIELRERERLTVQDLKQQL
jgi:hypothetical protein